MSQSPIASRTFWRTAVLLPLVCTSCLQPREQKNSGHAEANACAAKCHGDGTTPAPPTDVSGNSDEKSPGVGVHRRHLALQLPSGPLACNVCHVVPQTTDALGHADDPLPAEVVFHADAVPNGRDAKYDAQNRTCAQTYCHGGPGRGASWIAAAVWNAPKSSAQACGTSCHALPPGGAHPKSDQCEACHESAGPNRTIAKPNLHLNKKVETTGCTSCHGGLKNAAPPHDLSGSNDIASIGVGAHQTHLSGGAFSRPVKCEACHVVPNDDNAPGHMDSATPAELTFSELAVQQSTPVWDRATTSCSNTYCHGSARSGGLHRRPVWTKVDGTQRSCTSCHGFPPPAPHPQNPACEHCHGDSVGTSMTTANRDKHINGKVDFKADRCNACHGSASNPAPPQSLNQATATSDIGVGAHQAHLTGGSSSKPVECAACHRVPTSTDAPGHIDSAPPAELMFSGLASFAGSSPTWTRSTATCAATYCHGATLSGGNRTTPIWTQVDGSQRACGSCHGFPPSPPHAANRDCGRCHSPTAGPNGVIANRATHIDGTVQITNGPCRACHGDTTSPAPPKDTNGNTATSFPGVGAHARHVDAKQMKIASPVPCDACHQVPAASQNHLNSRADVAFAGLANNSAADSAVLHKTSPVWSGAPTYTCSQVYCHGGWSETASGGLATQPVWTRVDGSQITCQSCHGAPPPAPHPNDARCSVCHGSVIDAQLGLVNVAKHVNGNIDF